MSKTIYKDPARFYVYAFLREDGSPYYIGKGQGNRAWKKRRRNSPPTDSSRISILKETLTETEAFDEEIRLITFYGRKDLGTGCLINLTDGGDGPSGCKRSQEYRDKISEAMIGKHHTQESLDKMSGENNHMFGKTGEKHPNFGKKQSAEHIANKTGEKSPNYGKKATPETLAKISAAMTGKRWTAEAIAKRTATRKRNKEAKEALALHF